VSLRLRRGARDEAQVAEHLPKRHKALGSILSAEKQEEQQQQKVKAHK
jgi:hypothetical protein